jgi:hypothetical protein
MNAAHSAFGGAPGTDTSAVPVDEGAIDAEVVALAEGVPEGVADGEPGVVETPGAWPPQPVSTARTRDGKRETASLDALERTCKT